MLETKNGRAFAARPPIELGDFLPEMTSVVINGQAHQAWITTNRRYPRRIMAQLDRARAIYTRALDNARTPTVDELREMAPDEVAERTAEVEAAWDSANVARQRFVTDAIMALIPTLDESAVELIDIDAAEGLLSDLGYFRPQNGIEVEQKPEVEENAPAATPLTGATSPEGSPTSTPATLTNAS